MHHTVVVYDLEYLEETLSQFSKIQTSFIDGFEAKLNVSITALQEFIHGHVTRLLHLAETEKIGLLSRGKSKIIIDHFDRTYNKLKEIRTNVAEPGFQTYEILAKIQFEIISTKADTVIFCSNKLDFIPLIQVLNNSGYNTFIVDSNLEMIADVERNLLNGHCQFTINVIEDKKDIFMSLPGFIINKLSESDFQIDNPYLSGTKGYYRTGLVMEINFDSNEGIIKHKDRYISFHIGNIPQNQYQFLKPGVQVYFHDYGHKAHCVEIISFRFLEKDNYKSYL
ncbi:MAG: hypothetical protein H6546_01370 [Chitinophagales bacterium]|nr:hypothetical protein [Chitinophagales bacterium]